jgi:hypothetical protein
VEKPTSRKAGTALWSYPTNGQWSSSSDAKTVFCPTACARRLVPQRGVKMKSGGWHTWRFPGRRCCCTSSTVALADFPRMGHRDDWNHGTHRVSCSALPADLIERVDRRAA